MGLDMYLIKEKTKKEEEEVFYWRKANAIHRFFEEKNDSLEDCEKMEVTKDMLLELKNKCEEIKDKAILKQGKIKNGRKFTKNGFEDILINGKYIENYEEMAKILPTQEGFFFGPTEYNEFYYNDIILTLEKVNELLENFDFENEKLFYYAWW